MKLIFSIVSVSDDFVEHHIADVLYIPKARAKDSLIF